ncbi:hypothetical protein CYMTET_18078 [Cymbomonas tetramitiformis]|uniref:Ankyrin repeat domain-containing protein n=1 Tax=Cymbomonas tetramitiformis TaxID=36881 RepID=A0AAE0G9F3_9CHLO|nr:hypothetical protein CYMTET_18078 [Cymbomonas tetramitiformis]
MSTPLPSHHPHPATELMEASSKGLRDEVDRLISAGALINEYDEPGFSALIWASLMGHAEVVKLLLSKGAEVNPPPGKHTPIRGAGNYGHPAVVKMLLDAGADPNIPSAGGRTPLMGAAMNGHGGIVKMLLTAGAKPEVTNEGGETALDLAKLKGHSEISDILGSS